MQKITYFCRKSHFPKDAPSCLGYREGRLDTAADIDHQPRKWACCRCLFLDGANLPTINLSPNLPNVSFSADICYQPTTSTNWSAVLSIHLCLGCSSLATVPCLVYLSWNFTSRASRSLHVWHLIARDQQPAYLFSSILLNYLLETTAGLSLVLRYMLIASCVQEKPAK